jgi:hypothetical protein
MPSHRTGRCIIALVLACVLAPAATAQGACDGEHYREFDFWIGEWDLTNLRLQEDGSWTDAGNATNRVFPVAGGCGIVELWDGYLGDNHIRGFSVRTYNSETEKWHLLLNWPQKNAAGFGTLEGVFQHGRGDFYTSFTSQDGQAGLTRYSFADISHNTFRWNDGTSLDGGQTWRTAWIMEFRRRDPMANPLFNVPLFGTDEDAQCTDAHYQAGNFLIGNWESTDPEGSKFRVEGTPIVDGCAIMEFITGDNGTDAFTVVGYDGRMQHWMMYHLDGGDGFDRYHGQMDGDAIVFSDDGGTERARLVPGDGNSLTRVVGGRAIEFVRR